jgi:hypothetical protein
MISTKSIIYSFIISFVSTIILKGYEKVNQKEYESSEYVKIFLIVLLSSIFTFYIKNLVNPLINSFTGTSKGGSTGTNNVLNFKPQMATPNIPGLMTGGMNLNPTGMTFNTNKPMF